MVILGLTGSIGMGKTVAARDFRRLGVPVHDADAAVHALMAPGGEAVAAVAAAFPGVENDGAIDRQALGADVFKDESALRRLEAILHPLVRRRTDAFLRRAARRRAPLVVLDVPLLFETGGERRCDAVACVTAPVWLQRRRVLARPGMTVEKLAAVSAKQMSDADKQRRADFLIQTGLGRGFSLRRIKAIVKIAAGIVPRNWPPRAAMHGYQGA